MNGFDADQLITDIASAPTPQARFAALVAGVEPLGIDTVNYGFFNTDAAKSAGSDIQFMTTMSDDWMTYYHDANLGLNDMHVVRLCAGKLTPYVWGTGTIGNIPEAQRKTSLEVAEAGLLSGMCIPLTNPLKPGVPVAAINFGAGLEETEFRAIMQEHGSKLTSLAHFMHHASILQIWCEQDGSQRLSVRERDCLQFVADGKRHDAIAHNLGIARVTVDVHLRSARKKLGAQTLSQAVARGLLFGELKQT